MNDVASSGGLLLVHLITRVVLGTVLSSAKLRVSDLSRSICDDTRCLREGIEKEEEEMPCQPHEMLPDNIKRGPPAPCLYLTVYHKKL